MQICRKKTGNFWVVDIVCVHIRWFLPSLHLLLFLFNAHSFRIRENYTFLKDFFFDVGYFKAFF